MTAQPIQAALLDKSAVREVYTSLAPMYDTWAALTEVRARVSALQLAAVKDGEHVLEVAVGTGLAFEELVRANPGGLTEGVDLTAAMLAKAQARVAGVDASRWRLSVGDAYALPFRDASFDLVLNNYMFDLLPEGDFAQVLGEMHRVLRPGGRLVLVNMAQGGRWWHRALDNAYRLAPRLMGGCRGVTMAPHVATTGFVAVREHRVVQCGFPSEVIHAERATGGVQ